MKETDVESVIPLAAAKGARAGINSDDRADRFSTLPDNIITRIFSSLTMKEALAICICCKKLRHLWITIPHLEFNESADHSFNLLVDAKKRNLVQVIDRFLKHHDYPVQTFRLSFYPGCYSREVFSWIGLVTKMGLEELDLNFLSNLGMPNQLPLSLLNSQTLQVLKLRSCILDSPMGFVGFTSLNSLFLGDVSLSDDVIHALLCQSGLLQSLTIHNCEGFRIIEVTDVNAKLEAISLENCYGLSKLFAQRARTLYIGLGNIKVLVVEAYQVRNLSILPKSPRLVSQGDALWKIRRVLDIMKFSTDEEQEHTMNLEYQGVAKLELETHSHDFEQLHGHTWLLRNAFVDKVVLSIVD